MRHQRSAPVYEQHRDVQHVVHISLKAEVVIKHEGDDAGPVTGHQALIADHMGLPSALSGETRGLGPSWEIGQG